MYGSRTKGRSHAKTPLLLPLPPPPLPPPGQIPRQTQNSAKACCTHLRTRELRRWWYASAPENPIRTKITLLPELSVVLL